MFVLLLKLSTIMDKIFEKNSRFASINKIFILGGRVGTRLKFYDVLRFSWLLLISLDLKS